MRQGRFFTCGNDSSAPLVQTRIIILFLLLLLLLVSAITFTETFSGTGANHIADKQTSALLLERVQSLINVAAFSQHLLHIPDGSSFSATSQGLFVR